MLDRYATAIDARDWDLMRTCFRPDATADYPRTGHHEGVGSIISSIRAVIDPLDVTQHVITNHVVVVRGNDARSTCYLTAQHVLRDAPGGSYYTVGGRYSDELVREEGVWWIRYRKLDVLWTAGNAEMLGRPLGAGRP